MISSERASLKRFIKIYQKFIKRLSKSHQNESIIVLGSKRLFCLPRKCTPQFECAMDCLQRSVFLPGKKYSPIQNRTDLRGVLFSMWV